MLNNHGREQDQNRTRPGTQQPENVRDIDGYLPHMSSYAGQVHDLCTNVWDGLSGPNGSLQSSCTGDKWRMLEYSDLISESSDRLVFGFWNIALLRLTLSPKALKKKKKKRVFRWFGVATGFHWEDFLWLCDNKELQTERGWILKSFTEKTEGYHRCFW